MNETRKPDKLDNFTGKAGEEHSHFTPPALDSAFPSVKLMLVLIGLVIVLITISGWKVFNIEKKRLILKPNAVFWSVIKMRLLLCAGNCLSWKTDNRN